MLKCWQVKCLVTHERALLTGYAILFHETWMLTEVCSLFTYETVMLTGVCSLVRHERAMLTGVWALVTCEREKLTGTITHPITLGAECVFPCTEFQSIQTGTYSMLFCSAKVCQNSILLTTLRQMTGKTRGLCYRMRTQGAILWHQVV